MVYTKELEKHRPFQIPNLHIDGVRTKKENGGNATDVKYMCSGRQNLAKF